MARKREDPRPNDWGGTEVHDWGVAPPAEGGLLGAAHGIASVSGASAGGIGVSPLLSEPTETTPLDGDGTAIIPREVLWAMRDRRHSSSHSRGDQVEPCLGSGDRTIFVIEDGGTHCMIGRRVGEADDGCRYSLVARISMDRLSELRDEYVPIDQAFADARDISLCGVFVSDRGASNVILVQHYRRAADVPVEYLPPSPFLTFTSGGDEGPTS